MKANRPRGGPTVSDLRSAAVVGPMRAWPAGCGGARRRASQARRIVRAVGLRATGRVAEIADELRRRPAGESAVEALRAVLYAEVDVEGMLRRWELRNELVRVYPALLPRHLASMVQIEEALGAALADRLGADSGSDPLPRVLVAAALAVVRSTLAWWWENSDRGTDFMEVLDRTFSRLVPDLAGKS